MVFYFYERCKKDSVPGIIFYGGMGIVSLVFPSFLLGRMAYAVLTGYIVLIGTLCLLDFFSRNIGVKTRYVNLAVGIFIFLLGVHMVVFSKYLSRMTPVFMGVLLIAESAAYFLASLYLRRNVIGLSKEQGGIDLNSNWPGTELFTMRNAKIGGTFAAVFCAAAVCGGIAVLIFTFGFGVGGAMGLVYVAGMSFLIICIGIIAFRRGFHYRL